MLKKGRFQKAVEAYAYNLAADTLNYNPVFLANAVAARFKGSINHLSPIESSVRFRYSTLYIGRDAAGNLRLIWRR